MRWVTFIWAVVIGACATMALPHLLIGIKRKTWENLFFAIAALSVAGIACGELAIMHSRTAEEIGRAIQWTHLPVFFLVLAIVGFVRFYFGHRAANLSGRWQNFPQVRPRAADSNPGQSRMG